MGQKCEWCRLEMGSGRHLIRYFYEKQQIIIILLRWVYALPSSSSPLGRYCSVATIDCLGSKVEHGILFKSPGHNVTTPCQLLSSAPWHSGDGGSLLMVNVNFLCGTQANLPPLFFAAEESLSSKIEFPNKRGGCGWWWARSWLAGEGLASLGNPWQRKRTILLFTSASLRRHDMGLG